MIEAHPATKWRNDVAMGVSVCTRGYNSRENYAGFFPIIIKSEVTSIKTPAPANPISP